MKKQVTNLQLYLKAAEFKHFQQMFPHVAEMNGVTTYLERNKVAINRIDEVQVKLMKDNIEFDERGNPKQVPVGSKIIDIAGKPQQEPKYDFAYKSEEHREVFLKANREFQEEKIEVIE